MRRSWRESCWLRTDVKRQSEDKRQDESEKQKERKAQNTHAA